MHTVVAIKQVPDTETVIRIGEDGKSIAAGDIKWVINPYDEYAVEVALRLKDSQGATVTLFPCSMASMENFATSGTPNMNT